MANAKQSIAMNWNFIAEIDVLPSENGVRVLLAA